MYHVKLIKALSYTGIINATQEKPDVFVEDKAIADKAIATGYFALIGEVEQPAPVAPRSDSIKLEDMKIDDLRKLAESKGIDTAGFKKKSDYVEAITAGDADEDGNEADYGDSEETSNR